MKRILAIALLGAWVALPAHALIFGADIGYLTDSKDAYFAARVGGVFSTANSMSHVCEVEIGYTSDSESGASGHFLPVTVNYRGIIEGGKGFDYYFGGGIGEAHVSVSGYGLSGSDWTFAAQAFAGVSLKVTEQSSFDVGVRDIWLDDVNLLGTSISVGDDFAVEAGFSFKF